MSSASTVLVALFAGLVHSAGVVGICQTTYTAGKNFPTLDTIAVPSGAKTLVKRFDGVGQALQGRADAYNGTLYFETADFNAATAAIYSVDVSTGAVGNHAEFQGGVPHFHIDEIARTIWGVNVANAKPSFFQLSLDLKDTKTMAGVALPAGYYKGGLSGFCPKFGVYVFYAEQALVTVNVNAQTVTSLPCDAEIASFTLDCSGSKPLGYGVVQTPGAPRFVSLDMMGDAQAAVKVTELYTFDAVYTDAAVTSMLTSAREFLQVVINDAGHPFLATITLPAAGSSDATTAVVNSVAYAPLSLVSAGQ
jgi:hypothetical protein